MKKILYAPLALALAACGVKGAQADSGAREESGADAAEAVAAEATEATAAFAVDSIHWADSLATASARGTVSLTAMYPAQGTPELLDSLRTWVARRLMYSYADGRFQTDIPPLTVLADGEATVAFAGEELMRVCREDFAAFDSVKPAYPISYEFDYSVGPVYATDKVVTYSATDYGYMGGAHGGTVCDSQTFRLSDGLGLTTANMFLADSGPAVTEMVKRAIYTQYFLPQTEGATEESMPFRDCLLIDPAEMKLPQFPPYFMKDGVVFLYQQYEIACYAAGMPACVLPYSALLPFMTPAARELVPGSGR